VPEERLHLASLFPTGVVPLPEPPPVRSPTGVIAFSGRCTRLKGGDVLIRAVRLAAERLGRAFRVKYLGDGPEREHWLAEARRQGMPADATGWLDAEEVWPILADADLLAVPSVWPEPFGLVGVEAGCLGVPAVAFATGGILDWLKSGESGELAPADPPTAEGLADAICRALRDPEHHQKLRVGAWHAAQRFSRERHLDQLLAILQRVADG
jgi:glycosyltransferase involved in cell wall biosynthesis